MTADALAARASAAYGGLALHVRRGAGDRIGDHRVPGRPQASGLEIESYRLYAATTSAPAERDGALPRAAHAAFHRRARALIHLGGRFDAPMGVPARDGLAVARELAMAPARWRSPRTISARRAPRRPGIRPRVPAPGERAAFRGAQ
jgi:hypothetical protein